jgi:cytoskeleton protein RodZ
MVADFAQRTQKLTHHTAHQGGGDRAIATTHPSTQSGPLGDLGRSLLDRLNQLEQQLANSPSHKGLFSQIETLITAQIEMIQNLLEGAAPQGLAATCNHAAQQIKAMAKGGNKPTQSGETGPKVSPKTSPKISSKVNNPAAPKGILSDTDIESIVNFGQTSPQTSNSQRSSNPLTNVLDFRSRRNHTDSPAAPTWEAQILAFGQEVKTIREAQGLSQVQLHMRSLVPIYHLRALEDGNLSELPEPIFVEGFLNRLCKALGEDGQALALHRPKATLTHDTLTSWQRTGSSGSNGLRPYHLYAGYATLMAGALGGLATVTQQGGLASPPQASILEGEQSIAMKTIASTKNTAVQKSQLQKPIVGSDLAPPEAGSPEKSKI